MASTFKFNKWLFLAGTSVAAALSYGAYALTANSNQAQLNVANTLLNALGVNEELQEVTDDPKTSEESPEGAIAKEAPAAKATDLVSGDKITVQSNGTEAAKAQSNIGIKNQDIKDQGYLDSIGKHSMGWKYKDSMVLAPKDNAIWKERQQRMIDHYSRGGRVYTWWRGFIAEQTLKTEQTGYWAHDFCTTALSYSEWTTFWRRGISKRYLDFVWKICAKDGVNKPQGWWWA